MYYFLDQQICDIKLSMIGYIFLQINFLLKVDLVDFLFYFENGEWEFLVVIGIKLDDRVKGLVLYLKVMFSIYLQRWLMFYVLNIMFFVVLMVFLIFMVFKLYVEFGEKIGYCLMVLLVYVVYLFMILENILSILVFMCSLNVIGIRKVINIMGNMVFNMWNIGCFCRWMLNVIFECEIDFFILLFGFVLVIVRSFYFLFLEQNRRLIGLVFNRRLICREVQLVVFSLMLQIC